MPVGDPLSPPRHDPPLVDTVEAAAPAVGVRDAPIMAWRANTLVTDLRYGGIWLVGTHFRRHYTAEAQAECVYYGPTHVPPEHACSCGLYAHVSRANAEAYRRHWGQDALCTVELHGEIAVHGDVATGVVEGYRSSNLSVVSVELPDRCWRCGCGAHGLAAVHPSAGAVTGQVRRPREEARLRASCTKHARWGWWSCAEVSERLGAPVRLGALAPVEARVRRRRRGSA